MTVESLGVHGEEEGRSGFACIGDGSIILCFWGVPAKYAANPAWRVSVSQQAWRAG